MINLFPVQDKLGTVKASLYFIDSIYSEMFLTSETVFKYNLLLCFCQLWYREKSFTLHKMSVQFKSITSTCQALSDRLALDEVSPNCFLLQHAKDNSACSINMYLNW